MKKWICLVCAFVFTFAVLAACGSPSSTPQALEPEVLSGVNGAELTDGGAQIAMLAYADQLETRMGQQIWATIGRFSGEEGVSCGQYRMTPEDARPTLDLAVKGGARLVIMLGDEQGELISQAQQQYPDVDFVLVDAVLFDDVQKNGTAIRFSAEQAGWMAGYASVMDGAEQLAFFWDKELQTQRYALGFILGAQVATAALNKEQPNVRLCFVDVEQEDPETWQQRLKQALREEGEWILFANAAQHSAEAATLARNNGARMILTDIARDLPQRDVLTAVQRNPSAALYTLLENWKAGSFPAGQVVEAGGADGSVQLITEGTLFEGFDEKQNQDMIKRFATGFLARQIHWVIQQGEDGALPLPDDIIAPDILVQRLKTPEPEQSEAPSGVASGLGGQEQQDSTDVVAHSEGQQTEPESQAPEAGKNENSGEQLEPE